jgi:cation diffusion facilitator family transporter
MSTVAASARPQGPPAESACSLRTTVPTHRRERGLLAVVALTAVMMVVEIVAGYATHSMALTADGWHMATHVGALGMSAAAYSFARRYAGHRAFVFGTGKIQALAGYSSALLLAAIAVSMAYESTRRLFAPDTIDFASSLPVAVVGLIVNLLSVRLLHHDHHDEGSTHEQHHDHHDLEHHDLEHHDHHDLEHHDADHHDHGHDHGHAAQHAHEPRGSHARTHTAHDHNHQAALMHVIADALTSALAIGALLAGKYLHIGWLDPLTGIVGGAVILKWAYDLCRVAGRELLDAVPHADDEQRIRRALEQNQGVRIADLHVWSLGPDKRCCITTLIATEPARPVEEYRAQVLAACALCHLTIEVRSGV